MKKIILGCLISLLTVSGAFAADETVNFSVKEEDKAAYQQQIEQYQKQAKEIIAKADAEITASQKYFEDVRKESEKIIADSKAAMEKAQIDAKNAADKFEKVKTETNAKIEAANARIKKASDDLKENIASLQQKATPASSSTNAAAMK